MNVIHELSVPVGWSRTTLADVRRDDTTSLNPAKYPDERFELYSIPAHETGRPEMVAGRDIGSAKKTLSPDTVLLSKINPRINRVWVVGDSNGLPQIGSSEWIPFCPIEGVVPRYLAYYLRQDRFCTYLASNVSGVGGSLMRVKASVVDPFPFALPSSREQQRIVEAIESYLTRLDDAVASLERVQGKLKAYRASVLKAAAEGILVPIEGALARAEQRAYEPAEVLLNCILKERRRHWEETELAKLKAAGKTPKNDKWKEKYSDPVVPDTSTLPHLPEGWCWATIEQLAELVTDGDHNPPRRVSHGVPHLTAKHVKKWRILFEDCSFVSPEGFEQTRGRYEPRGGDVIVTCVGTVGETAVVPPGCVFSADRNLAGIRLMPGGVFPAFVMYLLSSPDIRQRMMTSSGATAQPHLYLGDLRALPVPMPPRSEQDRIVIEIERLLTLVDASEALVVADVKRCRRLRQAILRWAFEGKLVDQDPNDEPAANLLARIRTARAAVSPGKKTLGRRVRGAA